MIIDYHILSWVMNYGLSAQNGWLKTENSLSMFLIHEVRCHCNGWD